MTVSRTGPGGPERGREAAGRRRATNGRRTAAVRLILVLGLAAAATGCGLNLERRASDALVGTLDRTQAHLRGGPGRDSLRATIDSLASYLAGALDARALPTVESAEARLLARLQASLNEMRDTATGALTVHWTPAIRDLVDASVGTAGARGQRELAALLLRLQAESQLHLLPVVDSAVGRATASALDRLALRLGPEFRAGLLALADSVARVGARAAVGETDPIWMNLQWLLVLAGAIVFAAIALWSHARRRRVEEEHRKSLAALSAAAEAIKDSGARPIAAAVQQRARSRGVEPWLHDFLQKQRMLVSEEPAEPEPARHNYP